MYTLLLKCVDVSTNCILFLCGNNNIPKKMSNNGAKEVKYIYQLPYLEHKELCRLLDLNDRWEELGGEHMDFDVLTIYELRRFYQRGLSPTEELLNRWGHQNHTVLELFALLSKIHYYRAMLVLKPFVDEKYHKFIYEGEHFLDLTQRAKHIEESKTNKSNVAQPSDVASGRTAREFPTESTKYDKDMQLGTHNLNVASEPGRMPASKVIVMPSSHQEVKIVNTVASVANQPSELSDDRNDCTSTGGCPPQSVPAESEPEPIPAPREPAQMHQQNKDSNIPATNTQRKMSNASDASSVAESCGTIPDIPYKELMVATNGWDKHTILGKGGFGTVFKGIWKNTSVAIKRLEQRAESDESYQAQIEQSLRELRVLNACRHDNILPIYGFSMGGDEPCLVYQYMPNGSVEDRLLCRNGTSPLTWHQRHTIAEGTARGLQFLHNTKKPFIHGDIKSANILLDNNFEPRIGDFGLAREGPQSHYTHMKVSRVHGTRPYLPDEFLRSKQISTKVDTYSFGVVLFELATGQRAYDESRQKKFLKDHVEMCEDQQIASLADRKAGPYDQTTFLELVELGKLCVRKRAKDRPEMQEVLKQLEGMSNRRRITSRAHSMVRQLSLTPSNPYELQLIHDILSQQRRLSTHSTSPTASPVPFAVPDVAQGDGNYGCIPAIYQQQQYMFSPQQQQQLQQQHQQYVSPGLASPLEQNNPFIEMVNGGYCQKTNENVEDENRILYNIERNEPSPIPFTPNCAVEPTAPRTNKMNAVLNAVDLNAVCFDDLRNANVKKQNSVPSNPTDSPGPTPQNSLETISSCNGQNNIGLPLAIPAAKPVIAVTPPSVSSLLKPAVSNGSSTQNSSKITNVEEEVVLQEMNNFFPGEASVDGLPLLSALGIKSENNIESSSNYRSHSAGTEDT